MSRVPVIAISDTAHGAANGNYDGSSSTFASNKYYGNGYYGYTDGLHTMQVQGTGFVGIIKAQASLATSPTESDWFDVMDTEYGDGTNPISTTAVYNFTGNFVWVRFRVSNFSAGSINRVLYNT
jgi:hypothetical protein